ncbi:organic cation transporter protein isoform X2 [Gadus morhua]|uniref:organic cation transporter protein isoform X2 n=1 Tax=Gadus morhua TaxID=8049 RepID=UPI0011B7B4E3|nr:organic cation transporter protein-like isoform X2 [Gadus morhua]
MDFEEILSQIGGFGRFQKLLYVWICLPQVFLAFNQLASIFTGATPPHICLSAPPAWRGGPNSTSLLLLLHRGEAQACPDRRNGSNHSCPGGWQYDTSVFSSTVVTEWDLVCDRARTNSVLSSLYMAGLLVGAMGFGYLSDRYGRKPVMLMGLAFQAAFGVGAALAPNLYVYALLRFLVGSGVSATLINAFVLGTEWTGPKRRMLAGLTTDFCFGLGYVLLAPAAYLLRDWRHLQLAISAPCFLFVFYLWVLPRSARWLLANQRTEEAGLLIRRAARLNRQPLQEDLLTQQLLDTVERRRHTLLDLVRTPAMRKQSLIVFYLWFVTILIYYGMSFNISDFGDNLYLGHLLFGLVEVPARTMVLFTVNRSRRLTQAGSLVLGGLACLVLVLVPHSEELTPVRMAIGLVVKFGATASFSVIYIYSAEIFPTVIRQNGIGMGSTWGRLGGVLAPVVHLLKDYHVHTPMILFGLSTLIGSGLTLLLPETANKPLLETIEEVEEGRRPKADPAMPRPLSCSSGL